MKNLNKYIGGFIPRNISDEFGLGNEIDASNCKKLLETYGYKVVKNQDLGGYGLATTSCGLTLSTSGFLNKGNFAFIITG